MNVFVVLCMMYSIIAQDCQHIPDEEFGYIEVEPGGYMFFWLYGSTNTNHDRNELPIILWLAGGPGVGGSGYGNFAEFGPYDQWLNIRNNSWISYVNVLFIDNPYGAGYSYTTNESLYTRSIEQISNNLLIMHKKLLFENILSPSWFSVLPYYIFGESYGGKMAYHFGETLLKAIENNEIKMNLRGVLSCDGWINPQSYMNSYGIFALSQGLINDYQQSILDNIAYKSQIAVNNNDYILSHKYFNEMLGNITIFTNNVSIYDFINFNLKYPVESPINDTQLSIIMNGVIKQNLTIIPKNVDWGGITKQICFDNLYNDFMGNVIYSVNYLLSKNISCNVWNGNLDLIINNIGTSDWINNKLNWTYSNDWRKTERESYLTADNRSVAYYKQKYKNFAMYSILKNTGHGVPAYDLTVATKIMCDIVSVNCSSFVSNP